MRLLESHMATKEKLKRMNEEEREARRAELTPKCKQVVEQDTEIYTYS